MQDRHAPGIDPLMTQDREPPKTIAVALEEQPGQAAPTVTASGRGFVAEQILSIAFANGVKAAVSEILTYVYRANGQTPPGFNFTRSPS